ncbi:unnamed protein product [Lepeophtheirus salmonis]|uniref:(salmon louse) hypothetical protein n=1 Tax=Lepeophtheirus salmonis TaxID=72036 RepID=A0A7R8D639_LEPSM|nr:unnamed protein product [Lepeophtheirus salmonis]CAF3039837.1 unnamed protein product [Lepeophtheirus salmonis]
MGNIESRKETILRETLERASTTGVVPLEKKNLEEIPREVFKSGDKIRTMDLSQNKLVSLCPQIKSLTSLKRLNVSQNKIALLPIETGSLLKLEHFDISHNFLHMLPPSFSKLEHLKTLDLSYNGLQTFPVEILNGLDSLESLIELNVNDNKLNKLSPSLGKCTSLVTLRLERNYLTELQIPEELLESSKVAHIQLEGNPLDNKKLQKMPGYDKYLERYAASQRKMD